MIDKRLICPLCGATMVYVPKQDLGEFGEIAEGAGCDICGNFFFFQENTLDNQPKV